ncbi:hypothetical protein HG536_0A05680 [Torulaspora globosa]|uniref:Uncharacterized protein n=1 Tax=Torulaspora globosa TaxID=48254 RepID=A0A7G3ZB67_9SACH|nr:uncharacterized protein HG536_0A05680 [Torulaspora globosa]QLL30753.1 hypothetical protein HG536_0A05680 [Torulaspora globosa]
MSLEEFLGDDSLGESVWNEEDINLDAITNTTNIDLLKGKRGVGRAEGESHHGGGYMAHGSGDRGEGGGFSSRGPPYIVKFSLLPPRFSDADIEDLFHEKYTKFVKFKLFWELNRNPSIATLKEGGVFEQNFKRTSKVGFVELYSGRDMDKVLKYWTTPLMKIHNIKLEPAQFEDFKEYRLKGELLKDPRDSASRPYLEPRRKSNPFGLAKPVDTQSKILEIEDKVAKLHIEDTATLRRLSGGGEQSSLLQPGKVTLLKKAPEEQEKKKPLSYLEVVKKSAEESKKQGSSAHSTASPSPLPNRATLAAADMDNSVAATLAQDELDNNNSGDEESSKFTFKNSERAGDAVEPQRGSYQRSPRGGRGGHSRGHGYRGGRGGSRGGGRGGSRYQANREYNENENYQSRKPNRSQSSNDSRNNQPQGQGSGGGHQDEKRYSMFKPASGFLHESTGDSSSYKHNYRGGSNNRGRPSQRGRFTPA